MSGPGGDRNERDGAIAVSLLTDRIVELRARGHLRHEHAIAAQSTLARMRAEGQTADCALFDGTAMESFEPGLPARWVRWALPWVGSTRRVAIVGRTAGHTAVAFTFRYLLPDLRFRVFNDRNAAVAFLLAANDESRGASQ